MHCLVGETIIGLQTPGAEGSEGPGGRREAGAGAGAPWGLEEGGPFAGGPASRGGEGNRDGTGSGSGRGRERRDPDRSRRHSRAPAPVRIPVFPADIPSAPQSPGGGGRDPRFCAPAALGARASWAPRDAGLRVGQPEARARG